MHLLFKNRRKHKESRLKAVWGWILRFDSLVCMEKTKLSLINTASWLETASLLVVPVIGRVPGGEALDFFFKLSWPMVAIAIEVMTAMAWFDGRA